MHCLCVMCRICCMCDVWLCICCVYVVYVLYMCCVYVVYVLFMYVYVLSLSLCVLCKRYVCFRRSLVYVVCAGAHVMCVCPLIV